MVCVSSSAVRHWGCLLGAKGLLCQPGQSLLADAGRGRTDAPPACGRGILAAGRLGHWTDRPGQDRSWAGCTHLRRPCRPGRSAQAAQDKGPAVAAARTGIHQQDRGGSVHGAASCAREATGVLWTDRGVGPALDIWSGATVLRYRTLAGPGPVRP